jgi:mutator family transposase
MRFSASAGLTGLPDAITTVWPQTITQTCIVHYPDVAVMPMSGRLLQVSEVRVLAMSA